MTTQTTKLETNSEGVIDPNKMGPPEAKKKYNELKRSLQNKKLSGTVKRVALKPVTKNISEYCNERCEPVCYVSIGHSDFDEYRDEVYQLFGVMVSRIRHLHRRHVKINKRDDRQHVVSSAFAFYRCQEDHPKAIATTEGFVE
jgi:hypothetical protein